MTPTKKSSRLRRMSRFLPQLNTETKSQQHLQPAIPRKPVPSQPVEPLAARRSDPVNTGSPLTPRPDVSPELCPGSSAKLRKRPGLTTSGSLALSTEDVPKSRAASWYSYAAPDSAEARSNPTSLNVPGMGGEVDKEPTSAKLRKSWLPGSRARSARNKSPDQIDELPAWINAGNSKIQYNLQYLCQGEEVPELWNETADTLVYLWPRETGHGPQFRVPYSILQSSRRLCNRIRDNQPLVLDICDESLSLRIEECPQQNIGTPPYTPNQCSGPGSIQSKGSLNSLDQSCIHHLYFPIDLSSQEIPCSPNDSQKLVDVRNLFALLTSQPLVATPMCPSNFKTLLAVSVLLKEFDFSNEDGSSFGTAVDLSFSFCLKELPQLADCRESNQTTIEALILAEAMKSTELYNEAFAHAVGKYSALVSPKSSGRLSFISPLTRNRLEKSYRDLKQRVRAVNDRLIDFEFPSLFAGIAASNTMAESKLVRFKQWRVSFAAFRKHVLSYYKELHGQWPPKASSKKNNFIESGLNRMVLKAFYSDLCDLYDFLADRESLTTRVYDGDGEEESVATASCATALRKLLDEYDRSSPPVQPPIPFDISLVPSIGSIEPTFHGLGPMDQYKKMHQKLTESEVGLILAKSHNLDSDYKTPFIEAFKAFELKEGRGRSAAELSEQRHGHWIFLYSCIQALPLLVTDAPGLQYTDDAPGLQYTDGVEYFLCQVPLGNLPWVEDQSQVKMTWFGVQGGQQIVSLPSDVVHHGVEATYRRSHCWVAAEKWIASEQNSIMSELQEDEDFSPLSPPPGFSGSSFGLRQGTPTQEKNSETVSRCSSRNSCSSTSQLQVRGRSRQCPRNSIILGLERVQIDFDGNQFQGKPGSRGNSPVSYNCRSQSRTGEGTESRDLGSSTFDDILHSMVADKQVVQSKNESVKDAKKRNRYKR
ncbi:hypothetical protein BGT96224_A20511 [Blumeria graminis f. sp. tritici 96224]|uniref:DUF8004 domain-containing protein n=1 Tax=Blumeria graminis f. sp. tritici 96224 TaxID=1268274 RepID=A0A656KF23_BLUGR|nr:hypothetical protein BGT96224_A20511 [Blumeria graminis f. sp. tritici 96224]